MDPGFINTTSSLVLPFMLLVGAMIRNRVGKYHDKTKPTQLDIVVN